MTSSLSLPAAREHGSPDRTSMVSVGTIVWLSSELMFFAALFAGYFTIRSVTNAETLGRLWQQSAGMLDVGFSSVNTTVLVLSSVTCQMGVIAAEHGRVRRTGRLIQPLSWGLREWFVLTYLMGAFFIAGQVTEYAGLVQDGLSIRSSAYGSVFYLATGFHGLHVTGGLIAFLFVLARTFLAQRFTHEQAVTAIVVSYYWHFVDVVWIGLFFTIYVLK